MTTTEVNLAEPSTGQVLSRTERQVAMRRHRAYGVIAGGRPTAGTEFLPFQIAFLIYKIFLVHVSSCWTPLA